MSVTEIDVSGRGSFTQTARFPLTTIFTPPQDCTASSAYKRTSWSGDGAGGQWAFQLDWGVNTPSCYPSQYKNLQNEHSFYYSPGVCPLAYEYVATSIQKQESAPDVTLAICCPPGLSTVPSVGWSCMQVLTSASNELSFSNGLVHTTAFANPISVAWQQSDLALFDPPSAPVLALQAAGITFPVQSVSSESSTSNAGAASSPAPGISSGAIAGTVVGVLIALALLMIGLWLILRRHKRKQREAAWNGAEPPQYAVEAKFAHTPLANPTYPPPIRYEAGGTPITPELEGSRQLHEAPKGVRSPI